MQKGERGKHRQRQLQASEAIGFIGLGVQTTKGAKKAGEQGDEETPELQLGINKCM
jgi:hypothetical protein